MATQIYFNLPVKDLKRTVDFFAALGISFNPDYAMWMDPAGAPAEPAAGGDSARPQS